MSLAVNDVPPPSELLRAAYTGLAFDQGALLSASKGPDAEAREDWIDKGDWLALAHQIGASSIFFVDRDPVVVFLEADSSAASVLQELYARVWCMARPQLLFLATPGQLAVYDLTKSPPRSGEKVDSSERTLAIARSVGEVQSRFAEYHRERIETGAVFGDDRFRNSSNRADRALIRDLKTVRRQLSRITLARGKKSPELRDLHSLIGRAIFVRYLEDRDIITHSYFEAVAARNRSWQSLLAESPLIPAIDPRMAELRFLRVLQDKEFTYALFEQLAADFNGDTFPVEDRERDCIQQQHLDLLRGFLLGNTSPQQEMFFFAYRFDVIPIELISAIYEEFYNERTGKERNQGSHYTPPALVEFVLAKTLTPEVMKTRPRVLDPACGSGIFLVESFRRIVRYVCTAQGGKRVSRPQLQRILRDQIAGVDINEEAVRVAAFSLYLALLHYQEPREINDERRLPYLKWVTQEERTRRERLKPGAQFFDVLLHANAFAAMSGAESEDLRGRFGEGSTQVVVGNPPWGYPKKDDKDGQRALVETLRWCDAKKGRPIGDKELSQAFVHLAMALLTDNGRAGLLVSSGVFFKKHQNSRSFRRVWLSAVKLRHVVNFAHVRKIFFSGPQRETQGNSPFASVVFEKASPASPLDNTFEYWSAKRSASIENTKSVILNRGDMHWLSQRECIADERLWKIYWWGGHRDSALIRTLDVYPRLISLPDHVKGLKLHSGRGFEVTKSGGPSGWLSKYCELPTKNLVKYGPQPLGALRSVPSRVYRKGLRAIYSGHRLLVARGVKSGGTIVARRETKRFCFRNSIHGIRFVGFEDWQECVVTAVFWSSLARYYYFTTSGSWGFWHDEIHLEDVEQMPICFPEDPALRERIVRLVAELEQFDFGLGDIDLFGTGEPGQGTLDSLQRQLDETVFELYGLNEGERQLIRERCTLGLDLFYEHSKSYALRPISQPATRFGTLRDLPSEGDLSAYLKTFLEIWNAELAPEGEFAWYVLSPPSNAPLLALQFKTQFRDASPPSPPLNDREGWAEALDRIEKNALAPAGASRILTDTFFRYVSDRDILFIKRNEHRFWTATAAREDAESALTHLMSQESVSVTGADR